MEKKVSELLNSQINKELYSAYLYFDMANFYEAKGLNGFANWFEIQCKEEMDHAMLMYRYMQNNGEVVTLEAIAKPDKVYTELIEPLYAALEHEKYVTASINTIYAAATEANDYRTVQFLDWFIKEQGEEETNANDNIQKMELFGSDPRALYLLNSDFAARVYSAPSLVL